MGADFIFQSLPVCKKTNQRVIESIWLIETFSDDALTVNGDYIFGDIEEEMEDQKEICIQRIEKYWNNLLTYRDVGMFYTGDGVWYAITGGLSWGDDPTNSYYDFERIGSIDPLWLLLEKWAKEDVLSKKLVFQKDQFNADLYIRNGGNNCLYCESDEIEGGSIETDSGCASQTVTCLDCNKEWIDVYNLVDVEEIE